MAKHDVLARWQKIQLLLYQSRYGMTLEKLADECEVSARTIRRDLKVLESAIGVPLYTEGGDDGERYFIKKEYFLPAVRFSVPEAMNIYLATRLMLGLSNRYDPNVEMAFFKLNTILPSPLREQVQKSIERIRKMPQDMDYARTLAVLSRAWIGRKKVNISYHKLGDRKPTERLVDTYYIQPYAAGHSSYVIGYCNHARAIRVFHIRRIKGIELTDKSYDIPADFDANEYLAPAWGIVTGDEVITLKLKFTDPRIAQIQEEVIWHPSQTTRRQPDGSLLMTLKVSISDELVGWIMSWGENVEVLEPQEIRREIARIAKATLSIYKSR